MTGLSLKVLYYLSSPVTFRKHYTVAVYYSRVKYHLLAPSQGLEQTEDGLSALPLHTYLHYFKHKVSKH